MFRIKKKYIFGCLTPFIAMQLAIPYHAWAEIESFSSKLDTAAAAILEQHNTFLKNLDGLNTINNQLKTSLTTHEKSTQDDANYWLNTLKSNSQTVVEDIINYDVMFQSRYKDSIIAFTSKNKQETISVLNTLQNDIKQKQNLINDELVNLRRFRDERLLPNIRDFNNDANNILAKKDGDYAVIELLKKSIASLQDKYDEAQRFYNSIGPEYGTTAAGALLQAQYVQDMRNAQQEINREKGQITQFQAEVAVLDTIYKQTATVINGISNNIDLIQSYSNSWSVLDVKISDLIHELDSKEIDEYFFTTEMEMIRKNWDDIMMLTINKLSNTPVTIKNGRWEFKKEKWYYQTAGRSMQTGLQKINEKTYYFNNEGVMQTGWKTIDGKWFYFEADGRMAKGWKTIDGKTYFLATEKTNSNGTVGEMLTGYQLIEGNFHQFDKNGVLLGS
ncbi:hypothetical protein BK708_11835 [Bacillus thuringiensis serovar yunnanensis]|nr:hypothetical protein BK708_11835 [Bacillus thuringiensis serovar yunnanensis]